MVKGCGPLGVTHTIPLELGPETAPMGLPLSLCQIDPLLTVSYIAPRILSEKGIWLLKP